MGRKRLYKGCKVKGCVLKHGAKGYCMKHYAQWRATGNPIAKHVHIIDHPDHCAIEGCKRPYEAKGYCELHYRRNRLHGDPHYVSLVGRKEKADRNRLCLLAYDADYTLESIGDVLGITRQRVKQIVKRERAKVVE